VVDPGDAAPVLGHLAQSGDRLCAILATHHHGDHVGGMAELLARFPVPVFGPAAGKHRRRDPSAGGGERIELPGIGVDFEVIAVPGHTRGHLAYYGPSLGGTGAVFCGDTLFGAGCGRLFEGTPAQMQESLAKLAVLPAPTLVYCAHEYTQSNLRFAAAVEPGSIAVQRREDVAAARAAAAPRCRRASASNSKPIPSCAGMRRRARRGRQPPRPRAGRRRGNLHRDPRVEEPLLTRPERCHDHTPQLHQGAGRTAPRPRYRPGLGASPIRLRTPRAWPWSSATASYRDSPLGNPVNDAKAIDALLTQAGFTRRFAPGCHAQGHAGRHRALRRAAKRSDVRQVVFYYAGHGAQLDWRNYLLPVDAMVEKQEHMKQRCVDLGLLLGQLSAAKDKTFIVILDACRNNPFRQRLPAGAEGTVAIRRTGRQPAGLRHLAGQRRLGRRRCRTGSTPKTWCANCRARNTRIEDALKRVRLNVRLASHGAQIPWETTSLEGDVFIFNEGPEETQRSPNWKTGRGRRHGMDAHQVVEEDRRLDSYLRNFPNGRFAEIAQMRLARLLAEVEQRAAEERQRSRKSAGGTTAARPKQRMEREQLRIAEEQRRPREAPGRTCEAPAARGARLRKSSAWHWSANSARTSN
jgi:hydroxyacylglutathione hydrolase